MYVNVANVVRFLIVKFFSNISVFDCIVIRMPYIIRVISVLFSVSCARLLPFYILFLAIVAILCCFMSGCFFAGIFYVLRTHGSYFNQLVGAHGVSQNVRPVNV